MESTWEILIWFAISIVTFFILNTYLFLRTAASIFLSLLLSTIIVSFVFDSVFSEVAIFFLIGVGLLYSIPRALRDKRDYMERENNLL